MDVFEWLSLYLPAKNILKPPLCLYFYKHRHRQHTKTLASTQKWTINHKTKELIVLLGTSKITHFVKNISFYMNRKMIIELKLNKPWNYANKILSHTYFPIVYIPSYIGRRIGFTHGTWCLKTVAGTKIFFIDLHKWILVR